MLPPGSVFARLLAKYYGGERDGKTMHLLGIEPGPHLFLFDGVCGLCSRLVQFVLAHDRRRVFDFASLQSPAGRAAVTRSGGNPDDLTTFYVFESYRTSEARRFAKGRAALFVLGTLGWPWRAASLLGLLPTACLTGCDLVARNRYRVFRSQRTVSRAASGVSKRFIDSVISPDRVDRENSKGRRFSRR